MKIKSAVFEKSAADVRSCPQWARPEFAFIGRSNVGKSSLINLLSEKRDLAKVSGTPGKTQLMNFFVINDTWALVDLPGYGYAKVGREQQYDFNRTTADFIKARPNLRCLFVLLDSRLSPQEIDVQFVRWLATTGVPFAFIFTKTDKQSTSRTQSNAALFRQSMVEWLPEAPEMLFASAVNRDGRREILASIERRLTAPARA